MIYNLFCRDSPNTPILLIKGSMPILISPANDEKGINYVVEVIPFIKVQRQINYTNLRSRHLKNSSTPCILFDT